MLPGLDGTGLVFEPLLEHLPEDIHPVVVRYPADRPLSFREHVEFVRAHLPQGEPFVLLAESFSGPIGLQLLAPPVDDLLGVIFVASFDRYPKPFLLDMARLMPQGLLLKICQTRFFCRLLCLGSASRQAVALFRKALASVALQVLTQRLKILAELPPPADTLFRGPALYLQATHDHLVPQRAAAALLRSLPQMQVERIRGPHTILLACPEQGAQRIGKFVRALTEPP